MKCIRICIYVKYCLIITWIYILGLLYYGLIVYLQHMFINWPTVSYLIDYGDNSWIFSHIFKVTIFRLYDT